MTHATVTDLQAQVDRRINAHAAQTTATLDRYQTDFEGLRDFIVPVGRKEQENQEAVRYESNGRVHAISNEHAWTIHPHAAMQLGGRFKIPGAYLRDLVAGGEQWERDLAARTLEEHSRHAERDRMLFRTVNGELRGAVSDEYKRLDSLRILRSIWENAARYGARPVSAYYSDTRVYAEFLIPQIVTFETPHNGTRGMLFGLRIANSDFGDGAIDMRFLTQEGICTNTAVMESVLRVVHHGRKLDSDLALSERTYRLESAAMESKVGDITRALLNPERVRAEKEKIIAASAELIDPKAQVERLTRNLLTKKEGERVMELMARGGIESGLQGEATRFKLSQAVGLIAVENDSEARRRDLHEIAGDILRKN